tara:strand:+ start:8273 stop:8584 length:312 start_codon:yes stop_codon:yes gene_type:complete
MNALSTTVKDNELWVVLELHNDGRCLPSGSGGYWGSTVHTNKDEALEHAYILAINVESFDIPHTAHVERDACGAYRGEEMEPGTPRYVIKCEPLIMGKRHYVE